MPVRLSALVAVDRLWNRTVQRAVMRLLKDASGGVRVNAIAALARHRVHAASGRLIQLLDDPKWYVRQWAARALATVGGKRAKVPGPRP